MFGLIFLGKQKSFSEVAFGSLERMTQYTTIRFSQKDISL